MRPPRPRLRFGVMMYAAAMAYLICMSVLWPRHLAGGYLPLLSSQVALVALYRGGTCKPFWVVFGALAAAMLGALMLCFRVLPIDVGWWPQRLYRGYRWFLWAVPPAATEWLLSHFYVFDPQGDLTVTQMIIVLELCYGLPLFLLCLIVALLVGRAGWARTGQARRVASPLP